MLLNQFVWGLQPELARSVSLHYPKSIAQAVSPAETTELAVKASRRPTANKGQQSGRPQRLKIGGEANGEVEVEADSVEDARQVVVEGLRVEIEEVVLEGVLGR